MKGGFPSTLEGIIKKDKGKNLTGAVQLLEK